MRLTLSGIAPLRRAVWLAMLAASLPAAPALRAQRTMQTPAVGAKAPEFSLQTPEGKTVALAELEQKGRVVLVVLRGYPGYQCPYCQKQAHDFEANADKFAAKGVELLLVYPGAASMLAEHAQEFEQKAGQLPGNFHLVIDPDYVFTNLYGLRWDAPAETAYPATFVLDGHGMVTFSKISHEHGDRTTAAEVLAELDKAARM